MVSAVAGISGKRRLHLLRLVALITGLLVFTSCTGPVRGDFKSTVDGTTFREVDHAISGHEYIFGARQPSNAAGVALLVQSANVINKSVRSLPDSHIWLGPDGLTVDLADTSATAPSVRSRIRSQAQDIAGLAVKETAGYSEDEFKRSRGPFPPGAVGIVSVGPWLVPTTPLDQVAVILIKQLNSLPMRGLIVQRVVLSGGSLAIRMVALPDASVPASEYADLENVCNRILLHQGFSAGTKTIVLGLAPIPPSTRLV
jgi:hypothetical protein